MTTLYHNPRCSKSRETLQLLKEKGETIEIINYLKTPPSIAELRQIIELLGIKPLDLVRIQEKEWQENFKNKKLSDQEILAAMIENPKLIERPIAIKGTRAAIGRPPEKVLEIL